MSAILKEKPDYRMVPPPVPVVRLDEICERYFGLSKDKADQLAAVNGLPVPTFRARDSQKSPRLVQLSRLQAWLDQRDAKESAEWEKEQV